MDRSDVKPEYLHKNINVSLNTYSISEEPEKLLQVFLGNQLSFSTLAVELSVVLGNGV